MQLQEPSQFYTGLVADLYDLLQAHPARPEHYYDFLARSGPPALELACGSGNPLLDLRARGLEIEGLDSSADMLARCRLRAQERGIQVTLHQQSMQSFELPRRYRAIYLAGASFSLLANDAHARAALECMLAHLQPDGRVLIPIETDPGALTDPGVYHAREVRDAAGDTLRFRVLSAQWLDQRVVHYRVKYERLLSDARAESLERDWLRSFWSHGELEQMVRDAGFEDIVARRIGDRFWVVTARRRT